MKILMLLSIFLLSSCMMDNASSCGLMVNAIGNQATWRNLPVELYIDKSVPDAFVPAIYSAVAKWNAATDRNMLTIAGITLDEKKPTRNRMNIISFMDVWNSGNNEEGSTQVYFAGNYIIETDIRINGQDFQFYIGQPDDERKVHFESLMIHEMGHVLGLAHFNNRRSVMFPYLPLGSDRTDIDVFSVRAIQCGYVEKGLTTH